MEMLGASTFLCVCAGAGIVIVALGIFIFRTIWDQSSGNSQHTDNANSSGGFVAWGAGASDTSSRNDDGGGFWGGDSTGDSGGDSGGDGGGGE